MDCTKCLWRHPENCRECKAQGLEKECWESSLYVEQLPKWDEQAKTKK